MDLALFGSNRAKKLKLSEAPYTYARVSAMKGKLVKEDDYNRLMKMKLNDIIRFMQDTEYKKEIDELAMNYSGIELVELALNKNLVKIFLKLKKIAEYDDLKLMMEEYMKRKDIWNIKTILRGKLVGEPDERIKDMLIPIGELDDKYFDGLLTKESIEEIISSLNFLTKEQKKESIDFFKERRNLFMIENILDSYYYSNMVAFSKRMPKQGEFFKEFIEYEIDMINIKTLLKLKKEKMDKKDIENFIIFSGAKLSRIELNKMIKADDVNSVINLVGRYGYGRILKDLSDKSNKDIIQVELKLNKHLLNRAILLLHQHPLSVDVILGYMFAKEIEIRNLRTLIKGRQLGLKEEFIQNELIIGG